MTPGLAAGVAERVAAIVQPKREARIRELRDRVAALEALERRLIGLLGELAEPAGGPLEHHTAVRERWNRQRAARLALEAITGGFTYAEQLADVVAGAWPGEELAELPGPPGYSLPRAREELERDG